MPEKSRKKTKIIKPRRPYQHVLRSLSKVMKINREIESPGWLSGNAEHGCWGPWPLRVTIWNIFKGHGGEHFYNDFRLLSFQSDLVLLQEALMSRRSLMELSPEGFLSVHGASYERLDQLRDGVMTLARMMTDEAPRRILCKYPEPVLKTPKAALVTSYALGNCEERLMVINIHATLIRTIKRAVEELDYLIHQLPQHKGPILFAGDFNTFTPKYFKAVAGKLEELGLQYVPIPGDPRRPVDHLDQLFVRDLSVKEVWVETRIKSSDHFPIRAVLEYDPRR
jgi:endonuclease/exonuclease/phosphatase (EEP) superfamily protein YafD